MNIHEEGPNAAGDLRPVSVIDIIEKHTNSIS